MNSRLGCSLLLIYLLAAAALPAAAQQDMARQVLAEINLARTEPRTFAGFLRESRSHYQGKTYRAPGTATVRQTREGVAAVDEAIRFLSRQKPLPPLTWSTGLAAAAAELAREQGKSGDTGHGGRRSSGIRERIERHGTWKKRIGENIAYGPNDARMMVMQLIIDDGVTDRGHRKNQFNPHFSRAGVACGPHPRLVRLCVIDFSERFQE